jgi:hypothetical protein
MTIVSQLLVIIVIILIRTVALQRAPKTQIEDGFVPQCLHFKV